MKARQPEQILIKKLKVEIMNKSKIEERLPEPQLNQGTNDDDTSVSQTIAKPRVVRWPDEVRLKMIEKSKFYNNPTVYQLCCFFLWRGAILNFKL